ncbi:group III truncated hemoglobin [Rhodococcus sp. TAF43]|uniref:group III truncated hemoglobin n=1 Tax=unclassified Rhodococcus (in: high G+C Gram-positive bacteria) TaxID=192944 RepID=UPI0015836A0D|nr:group III truncated hemoglobin [Rhodococcus sp. W8901]QKT12586.1 group III truncated hemoglobin [Rhodococcus sp. W8901]
MTSPADPSGDLATRADVDRLLRAFYQRALVDPVLAPAFETLAVVGLDEHLPVVGDFWEQILFRTTRYQGSFTAVHEALNRQHGLAGERMERWLELWCAAVDEQFAGPDAERAKAKARAMAGSLQRGWK